MKTVLHQQNIQQPYAITIDYDNQLLYWSDHNLQRIECSTVNGSNRRVIVSTGLQRPFDLTLLGSKLYISDWELGIVATEKSGGQMVEVVYNSFCDSTKALGIQSITEERQLLGKSFIYKYNRPSQRSKWLCVLNHRYRIFALLGAYRL